MTARTILLVDDDDDIRLIAGLSLEYAGRTVLSAASAEAALVIARGTTPDLVLLDVMMPVVDGPQTFALLREGPLPHTPVIFMTAKAQQREVANYLQLGAVGVIVKPFDPLALAAEIDAILARADR